MSDAAEYGLPTGTIGLKGPMAKPEPGTVPLRGDLAHIALADRYLAAHYVIPHCYTVAGRAVELKLTADASAETLTTLDKGDTFEVLDLVGDWCWGCLGPEGPTGYILQSDLAPRDA